MEQRSIKAWNANSEDLTADEVQQVLDYLLAHKKALIHPFLRERSLPFSGAKAQLWARLEGYIAGGRVDASSLVFLLDKIEGWGNQHIYLYRSPSSLIKPWRTKESTRDGLRRIGLDHLLNTRRPLVLPETPTLSTIEWAATRMRLVWVEKRTWYDRVPSRDTAEEDIVLRAYRPRIARGIISFDWDLVSGHAMLLIQRLPRGKTYEPIRERFQTELEPIIGIRRFSQLRLAKAIQRIESSGEVRRRQLAYETREGGKASLQSSGQTRDIDSDPDLDGFRQSLGDRTIRTLGNFYWLPTSGNLQREIYTKIYGVDQRVGIFGECEEEEVRYVLSRIRHYCQ